MPAAQGQRAKGRTARPHAVDGSESQYFSRAVAKGLEILEILGTPDQRLALNQIAAKVRLTKPSVFRLLYTLETTGYIQKDQDGRYSLTHDVSRNIRERMIGSLLEFGTPMLRELTREFRETTSLAAVMDNHIEVIAVIESPQALRMGNTVGRILQPHASSLGKCITAFLPEQRREHLLRSYGIASITEHTITDEQALQEEFQRIRKAGYSTDRGETCVEGYCFGAPIFGPDGEVTAALSMSLPRVRLGSREAQERIIERIRAAAKTVGSSLRG